MYWNLIENKLLYNFFGSFLTILDERRIIAVIYSKKIKTNKFSQLPKTVRRTNKYKIGFPRKKTKFGLVPFYSFFSSTMLSGSSEFSLTLE